MNYYLPTKVSVDGIERPIRSDFRVILEIIQMLNDAELEPSDKVKGLLTMFYEEPDSIRDIESAVKGCYEFIDMGPEKEKKKQPRLVDWEHDFKYIIAPVNRVLGYECRSVEYLHWWTFMGAYMEMGGDCMFAQILNIRDKQARGKHLEKYEREFARKNADLIRLPTHYSQTDDEILRKWGGG